MRATCATWGREFEVLVEGRSKRDEKQLSGRTSQNKVVVFDRGRHDVGDYVRVRITGCTRRRCSEKKSFKDIIN